MRTQFPHPNHCELEGCKRNRCPRCCHGSTRTSTDPPAARGSSRSGQRSACSLRSTCSHPHWHASDLPCAWPHLGFTRRCCASSPLFSRRGAARGGSQVALSVSARDCSALAAVRPLPWRCYSLCTPSRQGAPQGPPPPFPLAPALFPVSSFSFGGVGCCGSASELIPLI